MAPPQGMSHAAKLTRDRQALAVEEAYQRTTGVLLICNAIPALQLRQTLTELIRK